MRITLFICLLAPLVAVGEAAIDVGSRRELFVDDYLISSMDGATLRLHEPVARETVLRFDSPWEGRYVGYVTAFQDGEKVRLYYRGLPENAADGSDYETTCYAESTDGITFIKPHLGLFEVRGTRENNVVLADMAPFSHNFSPFLDTRPDVDPSARYKAMGGTSASGLAAFVSADGLSWRKLQEEPVLRDGAFDSQNVAFWSEHEQQYVCYFRTFSEGGFSGFRTVSRSTSPDFVHWSPTEAMSFGDRPLEHLYTNQTAPYYRAPHLYVAIAARFMPDRPVITEEEARSLGIEGGYWKDISDNVFMTSRGGTRYDRTFMEGFIRPGIGIEHWTSRTNYPAYGIVATGDEEMSLYVQHSYGQPTHHLVRYALRPDGFVSVHAPYEGGELVTKPLRFTGSALRLNFSSSAAGSLRVEMQDDTGTAIPGFALESCAEIIGNDLDRTVSWAGGTDVSGLAGKTVRLRLVMRDADLYSLRFVP